ncbi:uncharacterized protein LOC142340481 [Convolutriloba macropyga]|uniref:uncharacterized protein LOC142340481 n=1 Tax=Convolutriloba macropyga TaxID=536237 RepID=UPI003F51FEFD
MLHPQQGSVAGSSRPYYNPTSCSMSSLRSQWPTAFASSATSSQYVQAPVNYGAPGSVSQQNHLFFANQFPTSLIWNFNTDQVFTNVGLDYLGPFAVMQIDREVKKYVFLFTCLSRRGQPRVLMSDNATNFLGSRKQLRRKPLQLDHDFIRNNLLHQSIECRLNPPSASHFVGVWERLVQIVKRVLLISLGSAKMTPDVFSTIVTEAECLVNSRPLTHVRSDNKDDDPLTPNHFLLGRPFANVPTLLFQESTSLKSTSRTQVKQRLQQIWKRLLQECVPTLTQRRKWTSKEAALEVSDVFWLFEERTPRGIWPLGRVIRIFTGPHKTAR